MEEMRETSRHTKPINKMTKSELVCNVLDWFTDEFFSTEPEAVRCSPAEFVFCFGLEDGDRSDYSYSAPYWLEYAKVPFMKHHFVWRIHAGSGLVIDYEEFQITELGEANDAMMKLIDELCALSPD